MRCAGDRARARSGESTPPVAIVWRCAGRLIEAVRTHAAPMGLHHCAAIGVCENCNFHQVFRSSPYPLATCGPRKGHYFLLAVDLAGARLEVVVATV